MSIKLLAWSLAATAFVAGCGPDIDSAPGDELEEDVDYAVARPFCQQSCGGAWGAPGTRKWAQCYSCLCENYLGPIPTSTAYSSALAAVIPIYRFVATATGGAENYRTAVYGTDPTYTECLNPARLPDVPAGSKCLYRSRFLQFMVTQGEGFNTRYFAIFRKKAEATVADEHKFDDFGIIGYNTINGVSCWWDDRDGQTTDGRAIPEMRVHVRPGVDQAASDALADAFNVHFLPTEGEGCTSSCHDNDPFMYTPYLRGSGYPTASSADWAGDGKVYERVATQPVTGKVAVANRKLTSYGPVGGGGAGECNSCHRIGNRTTKSSWIADSIGNASVAGFESIDLTTLRNSVGAWKFKYWMSPGGSSYANYLTRNEPNRTMIAACAALGDGDNESDGTYECHWAPYP